MAKQGSKFEKYEISFKIELVKRYLSGEGGGIKRVAKEASLKSHTQLREWIKKYQLGELTEADKRGQTKGSKQGRPKTKFANKEEELEYLRLENEYLKKKLLAQGGCENSIANLWSSKNLK